MDVSLSTAISDPEMKAAYIRGVIMAYLQLMLFILIPTLY